MAKRNLPSPEGISDLKSLKTVALGQKHVVSFPTRFVSKSKITCWQGLFHIHTLAWIIAEKFLFLLIFSVFLFLLLLVLLLGSVMTLMCLSGRGYKDRDILKQSGSRKLDICTSHASFWSKLHSCGAALVEYKLECEFIYSDSREKIRNSL